MAAIKKPVVLVTGGRGLVGRAIQDEVAALNASHPGARAEWHFVHSGDADLRDPEATAALFDRVKPSHLVHLAARVGGLFANMQDNLGFFEDNLKLNSNVLSNAARVGVKNAIFCLSTCVFPADAKLPITEEDLHKGPPHFSNEGYAYSKRMMECQVRYYRKAYNLPNWLCVVPTNIYGPYDNFHLVNSHVIPALIRKCYDAKKNGEAFVVLGTGKPLRQFIYSKDMARIIIHLLFKPPRTGDVDSRVGPAVDIVSYICCGDEDSEDGELSIADVARGIAKAMDFRGKIKICFIMLSAISR
ncbi:NAD dependent epimerase/dehydratase, putative [Perkinsus marinus ATCC 50983]|uniref:NAD dependent epimerase/dehydratase, putative n=1 Tax=Perkinsus marinus (strain ATCC 50983 / TXsc) TaxID=423536 RepID=C5LK57_PERM5|nr:NAD dependent epimerase/dehydratase, putative [Perkinsus marinus ATCC 50983]EER02844.1 NAD dependent epimerase/dehydratase, putative [Perkinsus marinus ATCC 50983]|eukprot:XP_002771028.1 NAD dependent epimerase/dehydratase, putative [Perkinsus marinus ATCC 50983]